jgi:hypothetical protein
VTGYTNRRKNKCARNVACKGLGEDVARGIAIPANKGKPERNPSITRMIFGHKNGSLRVIRFTVAPVSPLNQGSAENDNGSTMDGALAAHSHYI